jgi:5-formyltetrahydrofolate cyclo-ligase
VDAAASTGELKRALRRALLAERRALDPSVVAEGSRRIVATLAALPELSDVRDVLLYAADPDEVDLDPLLTAPPSGRPSGRRILLPRIEGDELVVVAHNAGTPLATGYRGIREPVGDPIDPSTVEAVVVPGVAFGPDGVRLGRGAGFYDRLLPQLGAAVRIGVCLEAFVRTDLPAEDHDVAVDVIVTDASVRRRPRTGSAASA